MPDDIADLVAYLKRLKSDFDPGLDETTIRIGTILPDGRLAGLGDAVEAVLSGYFKETNAGGGVHGRVVDMVVVRTGAARETIIENARRLMEMENVFAVVAPFAGKALKEVQTLAESRGVPLVGPLGMTGDATASAARYVFHLLLVPTLQAVPLLEFAARQNKKKPRRIGPLHAIGSSPPGFLKPKQGQQSQKGWQVVSSLAYDVGARQARKAIHAFRRQNVDAVLYLAGRGGLPLLVREAAAQYWTPEFLVPGGLNSRELMKAVRETKLPVTIAYPTLPLDAKPAALAALRRFVELDGSKQPHLAQRLAYSAAHVLTEGLKRAGKSLARERLVTALESLYDFETGLIRPVRFGPSRRVGIRGAYVAPIDVETGRFKTNAVWIEND
jgi:ABC-type branched-subunit amino acid transport system substrate-binding protein